MSEAEGGLVNKSIFTVQQHYHKQETTILNDIDSMILNLLSLHNHVGGGNFFTPPWSPVTPPSGTQGGVTCLLPPPLPTPLTYARAEKARRRSASHLKNNFTNWIY